MRTFVCCVFGLVLVGASAQEILPKARPADAPALLREAEAAFRAERYARALAVLERAHALARRQLQRAVIGVMPDPPAEFVVARARSQRGAAATAGLVRRVRLPIQWRCHRPGTPSSVTIALHRAGTMVDVAKMQLGLVEQDPDLERVRYRGAKAALRRCDGGRLELHVVLRSGHAVLVADSRGLRVEELLALVDQALLDRLGPLLEAD
ncbi:MAG: hypothetical protein NXI31_01405 [bacterium]|nr:hypothetical protein [bacterium]